MDTSFIVLIGAPDLYVGGGGVGNFQERFP